MWEIGPGLAAVLGSLVGGGASFGGTWLDGKIRRDAEASLRVEAEARAAAEGRDRANSDLVSSAGEVVAAASRTMRSSENNFTESYARLYDSASRATMSGPSPKTAQAVLLAAEHVAEVILAINTRGNWTQEDISSACDALLREARTHLDACVSSSDAS